MASEDKMTLEDRALLEGRSNDVAQELLAERRRQIDVEGWTPKHDERHPTEDFALAVAAYALAAASPAHSAPGVVEAHARGWWPWSPETFSPKDMRRDLVRAGALAIAAIERLDREAILSQPDES